MAVDIINKSLLDSISIIANRTIEDIYSDKTIKAIVKKNINTSEGKYLVTCDGGDFYAYTQSGSTDIYQIGEEIYVLIPEGNMSQRKFIIGRDNKDDLSSKKRLTSSLLNDYTMIGSNVVIDRGYPREGYVLKRMQPLPLDYNKPDDFHYCYLRDKTEVTDLNSEYDSINYPVVEIDEESFINSAKQSEALLIRAKFKTSINTKSIGHYGIIVSIAFEDTANPQEDDNGNIFYPPKLVAYVLDTNKMTGNPMKYYDYTSQYMIAEFDGEKYLYIDSIVAFSEGFVSEDTEPHNENTQIYIDDLEIIGLNETSATVGDYKLRLSTPFGNTLKLGKKDTLSIVATTTCLNQDITSNTVFYWGVKDPSITPVHKDYNIKLGSGYRILGVTESELRLSPANLAARENVYMCVAVHESDIILRATTSLYNNNNDLKITIESDSGTNFRFNENDPILTCLINGKASGYQTSYTDSNFSFVWSKEDADFGNIAFNITKSQLEAVKERELQEAANDGVSSAGRTPTQISSYYTTQILQIKDVTHLNGLNGSKIKCKLRNFDNYVTYSCSVYRNNVYIGYASITLQNFKEIVNNNYYVTIINGNQVFQYDETGISPNSNKQKEPIEVLNLTAVFYSPQGVEITPKSVRWIIPSGNTLIKVPSVGLKIDSKTNERYFVGKTYPLDIKNTYDNSCNDNQVIAIVTHVDGTEYRQSSNLLFTKVGEIGTNGTDTVVKINELINVPEDERLTIITPFSDEDSSFYNVKDNTGDFISVADNHSILEANLYTNNTKVLGHSNKWSIAGTSKVQSRNYQVLTEENSGNCALSYEYNENELDTRIVEVQTSANGKYLYNFYGIPEIKYVSEDYDYDNYPIKILRNNTLSTILYDSGGGHPVYNENQGVNIELSNWDEIGYVKWEVESGPIKRKSYIDNSNNNNEDNYYEVYENPNLLLSTTPKAKEGSKELDIDFDDAQNIRFDILNMQNTSKMCADQAPSAIKQYINEFLADIENICTDDILSIENKISALKDRLDSFINNIEEESSYIRTIYDLYSTFFDEISEEYKVNEDINKQATEIYNNIQTIWNSQWPTVITKNRLQVKNNNLISYTEKEENEQIITKELHIETIEDLIDCYNKIYDNRSNENINIELPSRSDIFEQSFIDILEKIDNNLNDPNLLQYSSVLVEYIKILIAYIDVLINETKDLFSEEKNSLLITLKEKYNFLSFDDNNNTDNYWFKNINIVDDFIIPSEENIANIYDSIRELYRSYQTLCLEVKKYQVDKKSQKLNIWNAILKNQDLMLLNQIYVIPNETFNGLYMNNNIVGTVIIHKNNENKEIAKIYVPIIMTLNTYELASLNGWDGTSIEIGDDHILAPQVGAGIKDEETNTFTGMIMGALGTKNNKPNKVGLMGYTNGKQSVFIDSETGGTYFGLPENDEISEKGISEGRIELIPGGVSKIGNWKIGNRFLYNIIDGSYEVRQDNDGRPGKKQKMMIPHDKYGIMLSSDQPYIHVKGEIYNDVNGINYNDEYNNINPGDGLELKLDPNNNSLFSIVQHTTGFGNEENDNLFFGYRNSNSNIIKKYIANQNSENEDNESEYYIYSLKTDENNKYIPYYGDEGNDLINYSGFGGGVSTGKQANLSESVNVSLREMFLNQQILKIDSTGLITYDPSKIIWKNNEQGSTNGVNWKSITEKFSSFDNSIPIIFNYNKQMSDDINIDSLFSVGYFTLLKDKNISRMIFEYKKISQYSFTNMLLDNFSKNNYIQFYVFPSNINKINQIEQNAILSSEKINIQSLFNDINVTLFSYDGKFLKKQWDENDNEDTTYYIKCHVHIQDYNVNGNCSYSINRMEKKYHIPPVPEYGTLKISINQDNTEHGFLNEYLSSDIFDEDYPISNLSGGYIIDDDERLRFYIQNSENEEKIYDFIIWREYIGDSWNSSNIDYYCGQVISKNYSEEDTFQIKSENTRFFTNKEQKWEDSNNYIELSNNWDWYISFYPEGSCITKNIEYSTEDEPIGVTGEITDPITNEKIPINSSIINTIINITETYQSKDIEMQLKIIYSNYVESNSNIRMNVSWQFNFSHSSNAVTKETIACFTQLSDDPNILCIEGDDGRGLQGIPYSKTFRYKDNDNNDKLKIVYYNDYYKWVNRPNSNNNQYGYIDIIDNNENNGIVYYKYIKTIQKDRINNWFENSSLDSNNRSNEKISFEIENNSKEIWSSIYFNKEELDNFVYWKDFIRVGLDENGRLFSAGIQDRKTYSRTGKIYGFGKILDLVGQEIRVQEQSKNFEPILKIFSQNKNFKTTYITQGKNDNGNISIRTSKNGSYVELATNQELDSSNDSIPEPLNYIRVDSGSGIQIQANNFQSKSNINLTNTNLSIIVPTLSLLSNIENPLISYQIGQNYSWIKSPYYIISSKKISSNSDENNISEKEKIRIHNNENNEDQDVIITRNHYKIMAYDNYDEENKINTTNIQLQTGGNKISITPFETSLKIDNNCFIKIEKEEENQTVNKKINIVVDKMNLNFQNEEISLQNKNVSLQMYNNNIILKFLNHNYIEINKDNIEFKNDNLSPANYFKCMIPSIFNENVNIQQNLYTRKIYVGLDNINNKKYEDPIIFHYKKEDNDQYYQSLSLYGKSLYKLFEWFNTERWAIACHGNTVYLQNVNFEMEASGTFSKPSGEGNGAFNFKFDKLVY